MKAKKYSRIPAIPVWWPDLPGDWRAWLPSQGNVLFTLLVVAGLLWASNAGDLLVASSVPGYAVVNNQPAPGTVIAKALEDFAGEQGTIKAMIRTP